MLSSGAGGWSITEAYLLEHPADRMSEDHYFGAPNFFNRAGSTISIQ